MGGSVTNSDEFRRVWSLLTIWKTVAMKSRRPGWTDALILGMNSTTCYSMNTMLCKCTYYLSGSVLEERNGDQIAIACVLECLDNFGQTARQCHVSCRREVGLLLEQCIWPCQQISRQQAVHWDAGALLILHLTSLVLVELVTKNWYFHVCLHCSLKLGWALAAFLLLSGPFSFQMSSFFLIFPI